MRIFTVLTLLLLCVSSWARPWTDIEKSGTIKVATEGVFLPFNYFKGKELTGFEIDIANAVAKKIGVKVDWKTYSFDSLLIGLNQDKYDFVIASHGVTDQRAKAVDFTNPHYCTGGMIVTHEGGPTTEKDLAGKVVAVQVGTSYLTHLKKVPGVKEVKTYPKDTDALQNLIAGRADAWVSDRFLARDAVKTHGEKGKLVTGQLLFEERVAMAVAKGNTTLKDKLNEGLKAIQADGTYDKISKQYFGENIGCK